MDTIISWIDAMGFPMAMCMVLLWYIFKVNRDREIKQTDMNLRIVTSLEKITTILDERLDR